MEIERKFLVKGNEYKAAGESVIIRQGYLSASSNRTVRVRRYGERAFLTVKGETISCCREEFEYPIPAEDADKMLDCLCLKPIIEKIRYTILCKGYTWVVDEFLGQNQGLVVAEIELEKEDQPFEKPEWIGEEVTYDCRYYNSNLISNPYCCWQT